VSTERWETVQRVRKLVMERCVLSEKERARNITGWERMEQTSSSAYGRERARASTRCSGFGCVCCAYLLPDQTVTTKYLRNITQNVNKYAYRLYRWRAVSPSFYLSHCLPHPFCCHNEHSKFHHINTRRRRLCDRCTPSRRTHSRRSSRRDHARAYIS